MTPINTLSPELQQFIKVFPPPYRYDAFPESIYDDNSNEVLGIARWVDTYNPTQGQRDAFGELICKLLNKYLTEKPGEQDNG